MKKLILLATIAISGVGIASAKDTHVIINTSCGVSVDMVYDTVLNDAQDVINDAIILDKYFCGD